MSRSVRAVIGARLRRRPLTSLAAGVAVGLGAFSLVACGTHPAGEATGTQPQGGAARSVGLVAGSGTAVATVSSAATGPSATALGAPNRLPSLGPSQAVERDDVGDPFVLPVPAGVPGDPSARYVLFWTTDWRSNVPTVVSSDLIHWHRVADSLPVLPSWATPSKTMTWGPSAVAVAGGWVLYFSTEDAANHRECIGSGFSTSPTGPYVDSSAAPLICQPSLGGSIDPSIVRSAPGGLNLVWKNDGNANGASVSIWDQQLTANGQAVVGVAHRLITADQPWQHGVVEGPAMLAATKGGWWLFYSAGSWLSNTYTTGLDWCATPAGPCRATADGPLLSSVPTAVSPGGLDTFVAADGQLWASYSAFPGQPGDARAAMAEDRVLEIAPITSH